MIIVVITIITKVINKNKHIEKNSKKQTSEITVIDSSCAWEISEWQSWIHHGNINKLGFLLCNGELLVIESSGDITYQSSSLEENIRKPYHFPRLIKKKILLLLLPNPLMAAKIHIIQGKHTLLMAKSLFPMGNNNCKFMVKPPFYTLQPM